MSSRRFSDLYHKFFLKRKELESSPQTRSLFIAPHADDETLGCGGTIAQRCRNGAFTGVVLMTDGAQSHSHLISESELRAIRNEEFLQANLKLGVSKENLFVLNYPDSKLADHHGEAVEKVLEILRQTQPDELFIPYRGELPSDHAASFAIGWEAAQRFNRPVTVYEYPIWFWMQWPFCTVELRGRSEIPLWICTTIRSNIELLKNFRIKSVVHEEIDLKTRALACYRSQMTRLIDTPAWKTLPDVSDNEFVDCFRLGFEIFRKSVVNVH